MNILESIGSTPLIELRHVTSSDSGRIFAKLEWANPTGSMKDRMARRLALEEGIFISVPSLDEQKRCIDFLEDNQRRFHCLFDITSDEHLF